MREQTNRHTNGENIFEAFKKMLERKLKCLIEWTKYGVETLVDIGFEKKIPDTMHESQNSFHVTGMTEYLISSNIVAILQSVMNSLFVFTSSNLINDRKQERFRFDFLVFNQRKYW